jgi:hypothetical protein
VSESIAIKILSLTWAYSENMTYILEVDTWDSVVIKNEPDYLSEVLFDTYNLLRNATVNLTISATTYNGVFSIEYIGISFGNYFTPKLDVNSPISLDPEPPPLQDSGFPLPRPISQGRWNFTWTCSDLNVNDSNYYSVWLSSDGGSTFQLLERNLTETFFVWDSDGFLQGNNYMYRVRAYSLDFTIREDNASLCSTGNPPESYWPGDYTDAVSVDFRTHASPIIFRSQPTISTTEDNVIATTPSDSTVPPDSPVLVVAIGLSAGMISGLGLLEVFRRKGLKKNE